MKIKELDEEEPGSDCLEGFEIVRVSGAKRALVGAGARVLFYPTLLYNVFRNKIQAEFRWWDKVDQGWRCEDGIASTVLGRCRNYDYSDIIVDSSLGVDTVREHLMDDSRNFLLLGAVPFPNDVPRLRHLGVRGVITLNESYETLVPTTLYEVEHRRMTPKAALDYVRSIRPRVLLAPSQWRAVQEYWRLVACPVINAPQIPSNSPSNDVVIITEADLEGYGSSPNDALKQLSISCWTMKSRPAMMARLSCLFASLKVSGSALTVGGRLPEIRAC
ncbi:putative dual specificity protein phosphatase DSP8 [Acorus gramineus]|uniref:Dual specificity protein phosphatase DSP8 n=1 Tax=Acorus gramineus TaxID=55184 RepID=A0AAV9APX6_ACOGR|nr:putative dual specificity protein phosphatase DSP8 [Acorus gramineus]